MNTERKRKTRLPHPSSMIECVKTEEKKFNCAETMKKHADSRKNVLKLYQFR